MDYLRFSGRSDQEQRAALSHILRQDPVVWRAMQLARELDQDSWAIVSGAIYNSVWNFLTGKPPGYGIKDIDYFYFDSSDLSYEAEDRLIQKCMSITEGFEKPFECRNQARVHLWFKSHFGHECPQYESIEDALCHFASRTHSVGVTLKRDDSINIIAPYGLEAVFSLRMVPNRKLDNRETHEKKAARAKRNWPEVTIEHW